MDLSSFSELLRRQAPELLPVNRSGPVDAVPSEALPHGTTIVALKFPGGVRDGRRPPLDAGQHDRRARRAEGVHHRRLHGDRDRRHRGDRGRVRPALRRRTRALREDRGRAADVPRQGEPAGDDGARQPRRSAAGLRRAAAAGGLRPQRPRIRRPRAASCRSTPPVAGTSRKRATSRSAPARSSPNRSIKKLYSQVVDADSALRVAVEALYDAADDDSATGGPDLVRGIYPTAVVLGAEAPRRCRRSASRRWLARSSKAVRAQDTFGPDRAAQSHDARGDS